MKQLTGILARATARIAPDYFLLPLHGADPVYRERVYCYELYHQIRLLWPKSGPYRINGEVDKAAHPYFQNASAPKPDFLVHQPGTGNNHAVVEVKTSQAVEAGIVKDIQTLTRFTNEFGYKRAIYLLYGADAELKLQMARKIAAEIQGGKGVEIWIHAKAGNPAVCA